MTTLDRSTPATTTPLVDEELTRGATDRWHVAARLEASGIGDRAAAQRHGVVDVFTLAALQALETGHTSDRHRVPRGLVAAVTRALLLLAGVATAAELLTLGGARADLVLISGVSGWIGGQAVAGLAWSRLGAGQLREGMRRGAGVGAVAVVTAAVLPLVLVPSASDAALGALLAATWTAYACAVSLLVAAGRALRGFVAVAGPLAVVGAASLVPGAPVAAIALGTSFLAVAAVVVMAGRLVRRAGRPAPPTRADLRAMAPAVAQATLLAGALLLLLDSVPDSRATAVVVASVVGAATSDPAIALLRWRARVSASRSHRVRTAARQAMIAALGAAGVTTALSAFSATGVVLLLGSGAPTSSTAWTVALAAGFTVLATTSAALNAFGAAARSVAVAALTLAVTVALSLGGAGTATGVFAVAVVVSVGLLLHRVSDPRVIA